MNSRQRLVVALAIVSAVTILLWIDVLVWPGPDEGGWSIGWCGFRC
jgi:hypothetical protein